MTIDLSLRRIQRLLGELPRYTRKTIHVAGTNGKGSVTAYLSSVLAAASYKVGRFNSPHLLDAWDCISVNNRAITETDYRRIQNRIQHVDAIKGIGCTNFEVLTATAFQAFEENEVDIAVIEAGMGGRLDATNALPDHTVVASAITNIDLDHQGFLGSTVEKIATQKAGIARHNVPLVLAPQSYQSASEVVQDIAQSVGAPVVPSIHVSRDGETAFWRATTAHFGSLSGPMPLLGNYQLENLGVALTVLDTIQPSLPLRAQDVLDGIASTSWPGRLQHIRITVPGHNDDSARSLELLLDGAHNTSAAQLLSEYLNSLPERPTRYIISLSHNPNKPLLPILSPLVQPGDEVHIVPFSSVEGMPWVYPVPTEELSSIVSGLTGDGGKMFVWDSVEILLRTLASKDQNASCTVVAGSLYLVADVLRFARDSIQAD